MPRLDRSSTRRVLVTLLAAIASLAAAAQSSAAAGGAGAASAGRASAAAVSRALRAETGYSAAQLTSRPVCAAAEPGRMRCLAQVLTVRSTGRAASLRHVPSSKPMRVARGSISVPSRGSAALGTSAPAAGTAAFLQWAYDTTWLSANRGAGDTVAIVDAYGDPGAYSDLQVFRSANGLPSLPACGGSITTSCFEEVNQNGQAFPLPSQSSDETGSWNVEESLDLDAVSSLCPLCRILLVEANSDDYTNSPDLETAVATAARLGANQISMSFGADGPPDATAEAAGWSFGSAAALAASGDNSFPGPPNNAVTGYYGRNMNIVGYPAALPNVTAVGGTSLSASSAAARGFSESTWSIDTPCSGNPNSIYACSGTESGCDTSQATPAWQPSQATSACQALATEVGTTFTGGRAYNDISADADPSTGLDIYDSQPGSQGCGTYDGWCVVGGTSLATPLTAAFEAITGISGSTPAWTYSDASLLNDVTSGTDGTCPTGATLICNAAGGWDGPTGNGSLNGALVTGGPGIGLQSGATSIGAGSASVSAAIDPNDAAAGATYYWQYGISTSYGSQTGSASTAAGTSFQTVTATLPLSEPCTYHYRLVAQNLYGTVYGYDRTVTPTAATTVPANTVAPTITGTAAVGQPLSAQPGSWSGFDCNTTYQWESAPSPSGPWTPISGATSATYTPTAANADEYLEVVVTEANSAGSASAASPPTPQVPMPGAATPAPTTTTTVRFYRCAHSCVLLDTHGASTYRPQKADAGRYIKTVITVTTTGPGGTTRKVTTRWSGPVSSSTAAVVTIGAGARVAATLALRDSAGAALARVRVSRRRGRTMSLVVTRQSRARTEVLAYVVRRGAVVSGFGPRRVTRPLSLRVTLGRGEALKLVAVRS